MRRRTLLAAAAVGTVGGLSGCLNPLSGDSYDVCEAPVIMYSDLPEPAREEVDTALETGEYETDGELLWSEITQSEPELFTGEELYRSNVETGDNLSRLWFEQDEGRRRDLIVANETTDDISVTVTVDSESADESLLTETVAIPEEEERLWRRLLPGYGEYGITIETDTRLETLVWDYSPSAWNTYDDPRVSIDSAGIELIANVAVPGLPDEYNCARIWDTQN